MSRNLTISYELHPPKQTDPEHMARTKTLSFPVPSVEAGDVRTFYEALRAAISLGKDAVGDDLTAWRDAVGNLEQSKEPSKSKTADDEEEEGEDEEEDEQ